MQLNKNNIISSVESCLRETISELPLILGLSIIKLEKMIDAIKGAIVLGIIKIILIISERTQYRKINERRIKKCIIEATEQSERISLPQLTEVIFLQDLCKDHNIDQIIFSNEEEQEENKISKIKILW